MDVKGLGVAAWIACAFVCAIAWSQDDAPMQEGQFTVEVPPRFITAYRDNTWIPVDVIVNNNRKDVSGFVQVELHSALGQQSPVYALPIESPKASQKRFRVYCNLSGTTEIQAGVYQKRWRSVDMPVRITLRPIDPQDLLVMVIDDDAPSYGFLYNALQQGAAQRPVHRVEIRSNELDLLPEHYACYEAYDAIVMGKTDPAALTTEHRALLQRYVEEGGVLIVCTGEFGTRYQGTWVEELAGVRISGQTNLSEKALAEATLSTEEQTGAREDRQVVLAQLSPQLPEVTVRGKNPVLATRRSFGSGYVAVIGVDASGKALQECSGYLSIWQELCEWRPRAPRPNIDGVIQYFTQAMPSITGVRIVPRSTVIIFLGLYILVGVIGNWVFWSMLKRREMAWVCLIVFSFGFTGYALVFGTAGRAKSTEMHEIGIVRLPMHGNNAHLNAVTGVLSARSSQYTFDLAHPDSLVTESVPLTGYDQFGGSPFGANLRPSRFVRGQPSRLEDFQVGASVFRVCNVEADTATSGGIQGLLTADENGLHGTLTNSTGWPMETASILYKGHLIELKGSGPEWQVETGPDVFGQSVPQQQYDRFGRDLYGAYVQRSPREGSRSLRPNIMRVLLEDPQLPGFMNSALPVLFCGWTSNAELSGVISSVGIKQVSQQTLVIAEVEVAYDGLPQMSIVPLVQDVGNPMASRRIQRAPVPGGFPYNAGMGSLYNMIPLDQGGPTPFNLRIPPSFVDNPDATVYVDLYWQSDGASVFYRPTASDPSWPFSHTIQTRVVSSNGNTVNQTSYRIEDWRNYYDSTKETLDGVVTLAVTGAGGRRGVWGNHWAVGRIETPAQTQDRGWTPWQ